MESAQPTSDRPGGTPPSVFDSLVGIFLDPGTTFRKINHAPVWFIPCLALVLLALCSTYLIVEGIGYENLVRRQIEESPFTADMSKEQKEEAIEGALASPAGRSMALIGPILFPVTLLLTAGILIKRAERGSHRRRPGIPRRKIHGSSSWCWGTLRDSQSCFP